MNPVNSSFGSASSTALSGMRAAEKRMDVAAFNIANQPTEGFKAAIVTQQAQPGGGVRAVVERRADAGEGYVADRVESLRALYDFQANLKVFEASNRTVGSLLDTRA